MTDNSQSSGEATLLGFTETGSVNKGTTGLGGDSSMETEVIRPKRRGRRSLAELRAARGTKTSKLITEKDKAKASSLGSRVRLARKRLGLSQQELAGPEYVASYISAIERDKIHPSLKALQLVATRLGEPVEYFLYGGYGSGALAEQESTSETSLGAALRDNLIEAQIFIERAGLIKNADEQVDLQKAEKIIQSIPRHQLTEYDRAFLQKLLGQIYLRRNDFDAARSEFEEAMSLAQKTSQIALQIDVKNMVGNLFYSRRQVDQALPYHRDAFEEIQANSNLVEPELKLRVLTNLANDYLVLGRQEEAVATFNQALQLQEESSQPRQRAKIFWDLAEAYRERGDLFRARNYATMSLELFRELNQRRQVMRLSADVGDLLANMGRENEAEKVLTTAMAVGQDDSSLSGTDLALTYTSLAWLRLRQGRTDEASSLSHKAIEEARAVGDKVAEGKSLKLAAEIATKLEQRDEAHKLFEDAINSLEQAKMPYLLGDVYKSYGEALEKWGDFAQAVVYLKKAYESKR